MKQSRNIIGWTVLLATGALGLACTGCPIDLIMNQTEERSGDITVVFINQTRYRAAFSYGTYDSLDRNPPGAVVFRQLRLEAQTTAAPVTLACRRDFAIGTQEFYDRAVATRAVDVATFDPDAFDVVVHFSDAPADSDLAAAPTVGTSSGLRKLLGVNYRCGDQLLITFVEDPDATGGFRIEYGLVPAARP